jgi:cell division protein FtsX
VLEAGCGLLVAPGVAGQHGAGIGDTITVQGIDGPVDCVVAGIGTGGFVPMSLIGLDARDCFVPPDQPPDTLSLTPLENADIETLAADLQELDERHGDAAWVFLPEEEILAVLQTSDQLQGIFNGLLILAILAAALGLVNTTMMSVVERQRELGLLRAVGATRRQVTAVVMGEAALMGFIGTLLGTLIGIGMGAVYALSYGGVGWGLVDLPLWPAAGETVLPALRSGVIGFIAAPLLAAAAAYPAVRSLLKKGIVTMVAGE